MLSLIGAPNTTSLLSLIKVKDELGVSGSTYDTLLTDLISQADRLVYDTLGYSAFRCTRRESLRGSRRTELQLRALPVHRIDAASYLESAIATTEFRIDRETGLVTRDAGFQTGGDRTEWSFDYLSGWFLVGDNLTASISVASADNSYNSATNAFPSHVIAGDLITASGFSDDANNGSKVVLTATSAKITVSQTLVTESAASRSLSFQNVPAELERAAMTAVSTWYRQRTSNPTIKSKSVDDVSITYSESAGAIHKQLDEDVTRMLGSWRAW